MDFTVCTSLKRTISSTPHPSPQIGARSYWYLSKADTYTPMMLEFALPSPTALHTTRSFHLRTRWPFLLAKISLIINSWFLQETPGWAPWYRDQSAQDSVTASCSLGQVAKTLPDVRFDNKQQNEWLRAVRSECFLRFLLYSLPHDFLIPLCTPCKLSCKAEVVIIPVFQRRWLRFRASRTVFLKI